MRAFDFMGKRRTWFAISGIALLISVVSLAVRGLNLGIDFTGGTLLDLQFERVMTTSEVRDALTPLGLGGSVVQLAGMGGKEVLVRTKPLGEDQKAAVVSALGQKLGAVTVLRAERVEPVIGRELLRLALLALAIASAAMLLYITWRFQFRFAVAGIAALLHDALIVIGFFSLFRLEVATPFVAAVLTVVGYSINDTIVVYDRIRENLRQRRREEVAALVNRSISETLARSINTSLTTLLAIAAVYLFGGRTTREFALALIVGIVSGTYSSIFVAAPLWVEWSKRSAPRGRTTRRPRTA